MRDTQTTVTCVPGTVALNQGSLCTARVDDIDAGTKSNPAGTSTSLPAAGTFSSPSCTLAPVASDPDSLELPGRLPADRRRRQHTVTGAYQGSAPAPASADGFPLESPSATRRRWSPASRARSRSTRARSAPRSWTTSTAGKSPTRPARSTSPPGTGTFSSPSCTLAPVASDPDSLELPGRLPADRRRRQHTVTGAYQGSACTQRARTVPAHGHQARHADDGDLRPGTVVVRPGNDLYGDGQRYGRKAEVMATGSRHFNNGGATDAFVGNPWHATSRSVPRLRQSCSVTYTPTGAGSGTHTITGAYQGSLLHEASSGTFAADGRQTHHFDRGELYADERRDRSHHDLHGNCDGHRSPRDEIRARRHRRLDDERRGQLHWKSVPARPSRRDTSSCSVTYTQTTTGTPTITATYTGTMFTRRAARA